MGGVLCNYHPRDSQPEKTVSTPKTNKASKAKKTPRKTTPTPKTTEPKDEVEEKQAEVTVREPAPPVVEAEPVVEEAAVTFEVGMRVICTRTDETSKGTVVKTDPLTVLLDEAPFGRYASYWDTVVYDRLPINEVDEIESDEAAELANVEAMDKGMSIMTVNGFAEDTTITEVDEIETVFEVNQRVICCRNDETSSGTVVNTNPLTVLIDDAPFGRYAWYWDTIADDTTVTSKVIEDSQANLEELLSAAQETEAAQEEQAPAMDIVNEESKEVETEEKKPAAVAVEETAKENKFCLTLEEVAPVEVEIVTETPVIEEA